MALSAPGGGSINPEDADNFEEIEKQFAVKGMVLDIYDGKTDRI